MTRSLHRYHRLLLSIVMAAILGQSLTATASSCVMMDFDAGGAESLGTDHHDHSSHGGNVGDKPSEAALDAGCCNGSGYCSMLDCLAVVALVPAKPSTIFPQESIGGASLKPAIPHFTPANLFKPPITA